MPEKNIPSQIQIAGQAQRPEHAADIFGRGVFEPVIDRKLVDRDGEQTKLPAAVGAEPAHGVGVEGRRAASAANIPGGDLPVAVRQGPLEFLDLVGEDRRTDRDALLEGNGVEPKREFPRPRGVLGLNVSVGPAAEVEVIDQLALVRFDQRRGEFLPQGKALDIDRKGQKRVAVGGIVNIPLDPGLGPAAADMKIGETPYVVGVVDSSPHAGNGKGEAVVTERPVPHIDHQRELVLGIAAIVAEAAQQDLGVDRSAGVKGLDLTAAMLREQTDEPVVDGNPRAVDLHLPRRGVKRRGESAVQRQTAVPPADAEGQRFVLVQGQLAGEPIHPLGKHLPLDRQIAARKPDFLRTPLGAAALKFRVEFRRRLKANRA